MHSNAIPSRSVLLHPLCIFLSVWLGVWFLYSLHLSELLIFSDTAVGSVVTEIVVPFSLACLAVSSFLWLLPFLPSSPRQRQAPREDIENAYRRTKALLCLWVILTLVEVVASGGVPLLWAIRGTGKTYFDFGIPSVHGLLNSLIQAIAVTHVSIYAKTGKRKHLILPLFVLLWSMVVLTRNMMIVVLLESVVIWLSFNRLRVKHMIRLASALVALVFMFGLIGDTRNSELDIRAVGRATNNFPDWMPTGVLWGYLYVTTPVNNLVNTVQSRVPNNDVLFPETTALLFPSVIRNIIYGSDSALAFQGELISDNFNVSTGYTSPFEDFGHLGMLLMGLALQRYAASIGESAV